MNVHQMLLLELVFVARDNTLGLPDTLTPGLCGLPRPPPAPNFLAEPGEEANPSIPRLLGEGECDPRSWNDEKSARRPGDGELAAPRHDGDSDRDRQSLPKMVASKACTGNDELR